MSKIAEYSPKLYDMLPSRGRLLQELGDVYGQNEEYLRYLEKLLQDLISGGVIGVALKVAEADNFGKFNSMIAELEIARFLTRQGKKVELLSDRLWKAVPSPDMLVQDTSQGHEAYVEVRRGTEDELGYRLRKELDKFLPSLNTAVRVDMDFKGKMVMPTTTFESRKRKEKLALESLNAFKEKISKEGVEDIPKTVETPGVSFKVFRTSLGKGYAGVSSTGTFSIPEDELIAKLKADVRDKARKRDPWKGKSRSVPYIIALFEEDAWYERRIVTSALVGDVTYDEVRDFSRLPILPEIEKARAKGWGAYLVEECFLPNEKIRCHLMAGREGVFLNDDEVKRNVSAVLVFVLTGRYYFLPNPFAPTEINALWLADFVSPRIVDFR